MFWFAEPARRHLFCYSQTMFVPVLVVVLIMLLMCAKDSYKLYQIQDLVMLQVRGMGKLNQ